jgi:hypothetical protein
VSCAAFRERRDRGAAADAHGDTCPSCREWLERQRRAQAALARLAGTLDGAGAPPRVEEELRRAFRERFEPAAALAPVAAPAPAAVWTFRPQRLTWAIAAVAACLVVAIAVVLVRKGPAGATRSVANARPAPTTGVVAPSEAAGALATLGAKPASRPEAAASSAAAAPRVPPSRSKRRPPSATPAALAATEDAAPPPGAVTPVEPARVAASAPVGPLRAATASVADTAGPAREADASVSASATAATPDSPDTRAFYPLRPEPDPSLVDSGQVVRVQLRDDVLRAAGLSPEPGSGERVEAEVLVGPDGIARGIRLARPRR